MTNNQPSKAIYLFCISLTKELPEVQGVGFDDGSPLFALQYNSLTAIVSEVPLTDFIGAEAEELMKDLNWIAPRALQHEAVIEEQLRQAPVLPARFGTLFSTASGVTDFLQTQHGTIFEFLHHINNKQEFSVKGSINRVAARQRLLDQKLAEQDEQLGAISPGLRYFQEQKIKAAVEQELNQWIQEICVQIAQELSQSAVDFRARKVTNSDDELEAILNWAFLIPQESREDFRLRVDSINSKYAEKGFVFTMSGAWPPYSFSPNLAKEQSA